MSYNYKEPKFSLPSYRINISWESEAKAVVRNNLDMGITIHLTFLVEEGNYKVHGGDVEMVREGNGYSEVYVVASLEKNSEKEIYIESI